VSVVMRPSTRTCRLSRDCSRRSGISRPIGQPSYSGRKSRLIQRIPT
jgi:hypothetical protein